MWREGQCVVLGRADLVEKIIRAPGEPCDGWLLRALYLGKQYATDRTCYDLGDARPATEDDHQQAKRYAAWFNDKEDATPYWRKSRKKRGIQTYTKPPKQPALPLPANPPRSAEQVPFPFGPKYFSRLPSPAGEGEPGSTGSARVARAVREPPLGGAAPASGGQPELPVRALPSVPVESEPCAYCGRRGFLRLKLEGGRVETRCSWHLAGPSARLPGDVRRAARR